MHDRLHFYAIIYIFLHDLLYNNVSFSYFQTDKDQACKEHKDGEEEEEVEDEEDETKVQSEQENET